MNWSLLLVNWTKTFRVCRSMKKAEWQKLPFFDGGNGPHASKSMSPGSAVVTSTDPECEAFRICA